MPNDLERLVGQALERLPAPRAPRTLLPRVLTAAGRAPVRPASGWRAWPLAVRIAAGVLIAVAAGAALAYGPAMGALVAERWWGASAPAGAASTTALLERAAQATSRADAAFEALRILWRVVLGRMMVYAAALILLVGMFCAGLELSITWRSRRAHSS